MEELEIKMKFCKHCGQKIPEDAVLCTHCGRQVEELKSSQPSIVINNSNDSINTNMNTNNNINNTDSRKPKNKWIALILWLLIGYIGGHKFYEGKIGLGILYFFTIGLFGIGWFIDFFILLFKPNPYYV